MKIGRVVCIGYIRLQSTLTAFGIILLLEVNYDDIGQTNFQQHGLCHIHTWMAQSCLTRVFVALQARNRYMDRMLSPLPSLL